MALLRATQPRVRKQEKTMQVLRHLRDTIYSTADILGQVMQIKDRSSVFTSLKAMEQERLITHGTFRELGGQITLWGITAAGQERAIRDGEDTNDSVFNPSKISFTNLIHYLNMQIVHVRAQQSGWTKFQYVDRYRRRNPQENKTRASKIRPDLIATNPHGHIAAIELERVRKSEKRYKTEIIPSHVRNLNAKEYDFVVWITTTPEQQTELYELFQKVVQELRARQQWFLDIQPKPFKPFQFANLQIWPNY